MNSKMDRIVAYVKKNKDVTNKELMAKFGVSKSFAYKAMKAGGIEFLTMGEIRKKEGLEKVRMITKYLKTYGPMTQAKVREKFNCGQKTASQAMADAGLSSTVILRDGGNDKLDAPMFRPNDVNWLTKPWLIPSSNTLSTN